MKIAFNIIFCCCFTSFYAQNIIFEDFNFKKALLDKSRNSDIIDKNNDGEIQIEEAKKFSDQIYVNGDRHIFGISNLQGIEYFENIKSLYLYDCDISTIDLSSFKVIESIYISKCKLTHIDISQNKHLKFLNISNNKIEHLDISNNGKLVYLNCSNNELSFIDFKKNPLISELNISDNTIAKINVNNLKFLKKLICNNNKLQLLNITNNVFLNHLNCSNNSIENLETQNCKEITSLDCSTNKLISLNIDNLETLEELFFSENKISKIYTSHCSKLVKIRGYFNNLKSIDVSNNLQLQEIQIQNNQIETLDFSKNRALKIINCYANKLIKLNIANGNNLNITQTKPNVYSKEFVNDFDATNNPNLKCIQVDNLKYLVYDKYWQKDEDTYFSENCQSNIIPERITQKKQMQFKDELFKNIKNWREFNSESDKQNIKLILDSIGSKNLGDVSELFYKSIDLNIPVLYRYLIDYQNVDLKASLTFSRYSYSNNNHGFWSFLKPRSSYEYTEEISIHKVVLNSNFKTVEMIEYFKQIGVLNDTNINDYLKLKFKRKGEYKHSEKLLYKYYNALYNAKKKPAKRMEAWRKELYDLNSRE